VRVGAGFSLVTAAGVGGDVLPACWPRFDHLIDPLTSVSVVPTDGVSVRHVMGRRPGPGVRNGGGTPVKRALGFAAVLGEDKRVVGQGGGGYGCGERA
jgi:hypothetical protein